jgi:hypothetical protein
MTGSVAHFALHTARSGYERSRLEDVGRRARAQGLTLSVRPVPRSERVALAVPRGAGFAPREGSECSSRSGRKSAQATLRRENARAGQGAARAGQGAATTGEIHACHAYSSAWRTLSRGSHGATYRSRRSSTAVGGRAPAPSSSSMVADANVERSVRRSPYVVHTSAKSLLPAG